MYVSLTYDKEFGLLTKICISEMSFLLLLKNFGSWTSDVFFKSRKDLASRYELCLAIKLVGRGADVEPGRA
jgi:hypothetical protein